MRSGGWELAQVNIALPTVPLSEPELDWFTGALDAVNAIADAAKGFRWRLQTEDGDATAVRGFGDQRIVVNMSVWASLEDLADFAYRNPEHLAVLRRRREGFRRLGQASQVLWWVPSGHRPLVAEAEQRLAHLRANGPTPHAFTFKDPFLAPAATPAAHLLDLSRFSERQQTSATARPPRRTRLVGPGTTPCLCTSRRKGLL